MGQRSLACGTLRVPREHGARGKVLNRGMLWNVSWWQNPAIRLPRNKKNTGPIPFPSEKAFQRWFPIAVAISDSNPALGLPWNKKNTGPKPFKNEKASPRWISWSADISEHTLVQNLLPSSMFPRHPKGATQVRLRWFIQSMTLDTYLIFTPVQMQDLSQIWPWLL